jgi:DMSO/TMAO reductase YedYZ heme-binding membrane subunit
MGMALSRRQRQVLAAVLLVAAAAVLAAPFALTAHHFNNIFEEPLETLRILSRLAGVLAVSFIFLDMMTGSFRPALNDIFSPSRLQASHAVFGVTGLSLAVAHFLLLAPSLSEEWGESNRVFFIAGAVALALLFVTVFTAIRDRLGVWRRLHLLNYVIFAGATAHALVIGEDRDMLGLRVVLYWFLALAFTGMVYRGFWYARRRTGKRG